MKRLFGLSLVGIFLLGLSTSHFVLAHSQGGEGSGDVQVCHVTRSFVRQNGNVSFFGHVLTIERGDLLGHLAHGHLLLPGGDGEEGACCSFCLTITGRSCMLD